jgi:hypothetical protein
MQAMPISLINQFVNDRIFGNGYSEVSAIMKYAPWGIIGYSPAEESA